MIYFYPNKDNISFTAVVPKVDGKQPETAVCLEAQMDPH